MAVAFVAAGSSDLRLGGTTCTPGNPAGVGAGDLKYLFFHSRGSPPVPNTPSGWTPVYTQNSNGRLLYIWRQVDAAQAAPSVTHSGNGNDVSAAYILAFSGVDTTTPEHDDGGASDWLSQANIGPVDAGTSDLAVPAGGAVIVTGHKGSASGTAVSDLSGDGLTWAEAVEFSSAVGNQIRGANDYALAPAGATVTDKTFTVTGSPSGSDGTGRMFSLNPAGGGGGQTVALGRAAETDAARALTISTVVDIALGRAAETNSARTLTALAPVALTLGRAAELDAARALAVVGPVTLTLGRAAELDRARALTPDQPGSSRLLSLRRRWRRGQPGLP